jgi:hypothetical protein
LDNLADGLHRARLCFEHRIEQGFAATPNAANAVDEPTSASSARLIPNASDGQINAMTAANIGAAIMASLPVPRISQWKREKAENLLWTKPKHCSQ